MQLGKELGEEFSRFCGLLEDKIPFAFTRYSDGELSILKNEELKLAEDHNIFRGQRSTASYTREDRKHFIPSEHQHVRRLLIESFKYSQTNYLKGISTQIDCPKEDFHLQMTLLEGENPDNITFANLLVNKNYPLFMQYVVCDLLKNEKRKIILIANEKSILSGIPFTIDTFIPVGDNCIVNGLDTVDVVLDKVSNSNDYIVLSSASSLSALIIHKCFKEKSNNTYINIGSTLNPILGFGMQRPYMNSVFQPQAMWNHTVYELLTRNEYL